MRKSLFIFGSLYSLFLLWQNRWFSKPLTEAEVNAYLNEMGGSGKKEESVRTEQHASFYEFLLNDDGKPFYMVNLMQYRETAVYPDGSYPDIKTGRDGSP